MNKEEITAAVKKCRRGFFPMALVGEDAAAVVKAVNQGIDAHLEALTDSKFSWKEDPLVGGSRLVCEIGPEDMPVLLRRLRESEMEGAENLAESIEDILKQDEE